MIISSFPTANLFLSSGQPAHARTERTKAELPPPASTTTLSVAGQLRGALDRLGATSLGLNNTSVFAPKPLSTEKSARQHADQEAPAQRPSPVELPPPALNPAVPPPDIQPAASNARSRQPISLQQFISEGEKFSLQLKEQRRHENRAAGAVDAAGIAEAHPTPEDTRAPRATPELADGGKRATSLAASASSKEPAPTPNDLAAPPASAPAPRALPGAARELVGAVNELRRAVQRAESSTEGDAATHGLQQRAERALAAVDRHAAALQRVGIERTAQGTLQVNEAVLHSSAASAPQQLHQVLGETRRGIASELAPAPAAAAAAPADADPRDNLTRVLREPPAASHRSETHAPAPPLTPAALAEQAQQLGKTLESIASSGAQLQQELVREDARSSSQSSLINRLNTLANALTP